MKLKVILEFEYEDEYLKEEDLEEKAGEWADDFHSLFENAYGWAHHFPKNLTVMLEEYE